MTESIEQLANFLPSFENLRSTRPVTELAHVLLGSFGKGENSLFLYDIKYTINRLNHQDNQLQNVHLMLQC